VLSSWLVFVVMLFMVVLLVVLFVDLLKMVNINILVIKVKWSHIVYNYIQE